MRKKFKQLLNYNFKTLLGFELIYKLLTTLIFVPLFLTLFSLLTKWSGYDYLTFENCISFLLHPFTLFFLVLLLIVLTFYTLLDISTVIIILACSNEKKKITIKDAFLMALSKSLQVFHVRNIFLPFLVLFLIPFLNIGISQGFITTIKIPEFIKDYIYQNSFLLLLYAVLFLGLLYLFFRWFYVLHYFVLENCTFKEARKRSICLSKKHRIKDCLFLILTQVLIAIFYIFMLVLGIFIIVLVYQFLGKIKVIENLSITVVWMLIAISLIVMFLLTTPISYAMISVLFYLHKEEKQEKIISIPVEEKGKTVQKKKKMAQILKYVILVLVLLSGTLLTTSVLNGGYNMNIEYVRTMEVTAHRGASIKYPENTMLAFQGAKKLGASWVELDVQQTKDLKLIVLHDTNLKRTTGVNKNTWDVTYDEVQNLDAGSFLNPKYKDARIPLLEEVIRYAKENRIKLNIELKPTGKEKHFEEDVVSLIQKYHFEKNCVITSQVYEVLEKVKKASKNVETVYVMSLAYGKITELDAADHFSIEASSVTRTLVRQVHKAGKELYVWTVNTKENIQKMIDLNVDNIITDNITLAKNTIYESKTSNVVQEYVKWVRRILG